MRAGHATASQERKIQTTSLRVVFFNRAFHPEVTATSQLLTELCQDLVVRHGCSVTVIAGTAQAIIDDANDNLDSQIAILRAPTTRFSKRRLIGRITNYISYFVSAVFTSLKLSGVDVVVSLTDPPIIALVAYATAKRLNCPFVMVYQDVFPEVAQIARNYKNRAIIALLHKINCFIAQRADRIVALSETMKSKLINEKNADGEKTVVIPNWTDCSSIIPEDKTNPFSLRHGLADKFVVMHSGNVGLSQDFDIVIEAAERLKHKPDITFAIVGDGVRKPDLQRQVKQLCLTNVVFFAYQPKDALRFSFAAADVFIVTLKNGLAGYIVPSKIYGILAAGRPYLAAVELASEVSDLTRKYRCGLLTRVGDPDDLVRNILLLYSKRDLARSLGANARAAALYFDRPARTEEYYRLFEQATQAIRPKSSPFKRPFDILLAGMGLLFSLPLWILIILAIKIDDDGPVFFSQDRVGRRGMVFKSLKFRSMKVNGTQMTEVFQAAAGDRRITRVGRLLRNTAMDELPQLWNIFRGDMSFVGPRALMPTEVETRGNDSRAVSISEVPGYQVRQLVRPGLTGIAQIYADRDIPRRHKFKFDAVYVKKQTFGLDLRLILISFWITFRGKWEHRGRKV
jgi:colanic acid biosynthesis glycosyl transferase WcaI